MQKSHSKGLYQLLCKNTCLTSICCIVLSKSDIFATYEQNTFHFYRFLFGTHVNHTGAIVVNGGSGPQDFSSK